MKKNGRSMSHKAGTWYESVREVRRPFSEYRKGILVRDGVISIIFEYVGSRRKHYGDELNVSKSILWYVGEGRNDDQSLNARNRALVDAHREKHAIMVYFDCGDVFSPKKLLCAGKWNVVAYKYVKLGTRKVYLFKLVPVEEGTKKLIKFVFGAASSLNTAFEGDLAVFSRARRRLYELHPDVVRSRDNISGEIGEYFAVKLLNVWSRGTPVIRLSANEKNIDAIKIGNGKTFAVKTIGKPFQTTSNIWAEEPGKHVNYFVVVYLDPEALTPVYVLLITSRVAAAFMKKDNYQGSRKLQVSPELLKRGRLIYGRVPR